MLCTTDKIYRVNLLVRPNHFILKTQYLAFTELKTEHSQQVIMLPILLRRTE